jgi:hypothetical protein
VPVAMPGPLEARADSGSVVELRGGRLRALLIVLAPSCPYRAGNP